MTRTIDVVRIYNQEEKTTVPRWKYERRKDRVFRVVGGNPQVINRTPD